MSPSTERLLVALRELPASPERDNLIARAEAECFHDFRSQSATPITDLVQAATDAAQRAPSSRERFAFMQIARRARAGDFDADRDEAEEWWNEEGRHLIGPVKP